MRPSAVAGRLLNVGAPGAGIGANGAGAVAYTAARYAVEGATNALRAEMEPLGVSVISLQPPEGATGEALFLPPRSVCAGRRPWWAGNPSYSVLRHCRMGCLPVGGRVSCRPSLTPAPPVLPHREASEHHDVLGATALHAVEEALLSDKPKPRYQLRERVGLLRTVIPNMAVGKHA